MSDRFRYLLLGVLAVYTAICVFGALGNSVNNSSSALLALSDFIYLAALAYPLATYKPERDGWFHPLVFGTLWVMAKTLPRRMDLMINGLSEHAVLGLPMEELTRLVAYENLLNALALVATYVGYRLIRNPWMPRIRFHEPKHLWACVGIAGVVGLAALGYYIVVAGSITQHFLNLSLNQTAKVFAKEVDGMGQFQVAAQAFVVASTILLAYRPELIRKPYFWLVLGCASLNLYFIAGKRAVLLVASFNIAIVWMLTVRKVPVMRLLAFGAALFALFSFLLVVRGASSMSDDFPEVWSRVSANIDDSLSLGAEELTNRVGSYTSIYPIIHLVPEDVPLLWGTTYLNIFTSPIPRAIWPDKPRGSDFMAGITFFGAPWGVPAGPVGEAYWNFHIPGVIAIFLLWGMFTHWLVKFYRRYNQEGIMKYFYACTLFLVPGQNVIVSWLQTLVSLVLVAFVTGIFSFGRKAL
jgi:hypothetical protein